jgi:hypothetical protein
MAWSFPPHELQPNVRIRVGPPIMGRGARSSGNRLARRTNKVRSRGPSAHGTAGRYPGSLANHRLGNPAAARRARHLRLRTFSYSRRSARSLAAYAVSMQDRKMAAACRGRAAGAQMKVPPVVSRRGQLTMN